jgi:hypothetical protein
VHLYVGTYRPAYIYIYTSCLRRDRLGASLGVVKENQGSSTEGDLASFLVPRQPQSYVVSYIGGSVLRWSRWDVL